MRKTPISSTSTKIAIFQRKEIRKTIHDDEWWFSVVDVCEVLTESTDPGSYWRKLKQRLKKENSEVVTFCHGLKLKASDGKKYKTDCANTEGIFRIIQSIPSPKAEPFKRWLAKVSYERIQEIENPELATTTRLTKDRDSQQMPKLKKDAKDGGRVAGNARKDFEKTLGKSVISKINYLKEEENQKKLK